MNDSKLKHSYSLTSLSSRFLLSHNHNNNHQGHNHAHAAAAANGNTTGGAYGYVNGYSNLPAGLTKGYHNGNDKLTPKSPEEGSDDYGFLCYLENQNQNHRGGAAAVKSNLYSSYTSCTAPAPAVIKSSTVNGLVTVNANANTSATNANSVRQSQVARNSIPAPSGATKVRAIIYGNNEIIPNSTTSSTMSSSMIVPEYSYYYNNNNSLKKYSDTTASSGASQNGSSSNGFIGYRNKQLNASCHALNNVTSTSGSYSNEGSIYANASLGASTTTINGGGFGYANGTIVSSATNLYESNHNSPPSKSTPSNGVSVSGTSAPSVRVRRTLSCYVKNPPPPAIATTTALARRDFFQQQQPASESNSNFSRLTVAEKDHNADGGYQNGSYAAVAPTFNQICEFSPYSSLSSSDLVRIGTSAATNGYVGGFGGVGQVQHQNQRQEPTYFGGFGYNCTTNRRYSSVGIGGNGCGGDCTSVFFMFILLIVVVQIVFK